MTTPLTFRQSLECVRAEIEWALPALPWTSARMAALRLRIEEAVEVSYEIELRPQTGPAGSAVAPQRG